MVDSAKRRTIRGLVYATSVAVLVWVLVPARTGTPDDPYVKMVGNAMGLFVEANGAMPPSLVDIKPFLDKLARTECVVTRLHDDSYLVVIPRSSGSSRRIQVEYSSGLGGHEEHYSGKILD